MSTSEKSFRKCPLCTAVGSADSSYPGSWCVSSAYPKGVPALFLLVTEQRLHKLSLGCPHTWMLLQFCSSFLDLLCSTVNTNQNAVGSACRGYQIRVSVGNLKHLQWQPYCQVTPVLCSKLYAQFFTWEAIRDRGSGKQSNETLVSWEAAPRQPSGSTQTAAENLAEPVVAGVSLGRWHLSFEGAFVSDC